MSSNLLKRGIISSDENTRVIDVNALIAKRLEAIAGQSAKEVMAAQTKGMENQESDAMDMLFAEEGFSAFAPENMEHVTLVDTEENDAPDMEEELPETLRARAEDLLAEAKEQAEQILDEARARAQEEAEQMRAQASQEGYAQGYQEANAYLEKEKLSLQQKAMELEQQYNQMLDSAEAKLVDTLAGVYEHLIGMTFRGDRDVLLHILSQAIRGIEGSRSFTIRVSAEDYQAVLDKKDVLEACIPGKESYLEILEDSNLETMGCRIETENGIFDCGLDVQLLELRKKLALLAYEKA